MNTRATPATRHLTIADVTALATLAFGGRPPEAREPGLLASAVHRPRARMFGTAAYDDLYEQAAALLRALAANHPGRRQQAHRLARHRHLPRAQRGRPRRSRPDAAYALVIDVAAGTQSDVGVIAGRLRGL